MGSPQNFCGSGKNISPPLVISAPDPSYDEVAESLKLQGVVVLWTVVDVTGHPTHIKIAKPFGVCLDERAVAALTNWKFKPATRDGQSVPVQTNVNVNFRLY